MSIKLSDQNLLDVESSPELKLRIATLWAIKWRKNIGLLAAVAMFCNIYYIIFRGGLNFHYIKFILVGIFWFLISAALGIVLGLLIAMIPIKKLPFTSKLPLAFACGVFLVNAILLFIILAEI